MIIIASEAPCVVLGVEAVVSDAGTKFELGAGVTYDCLDTQNYAWGFTCDYYHTFSHYLKNRYSISSSWKILF